MNDRRIDILLEPLWTEGDVTVRLSAREKPPRADGHSEQRGSFALLLTHTYSQVVRGSPEALPLCRSLCVQPCESRGCHGPQFTLLRTHI